MIFEDGIQRVVVQYQNGSTDVYGPETHERLIKVEWVPNDEFVDIYTERSTPAISTSIIENVSIEWPHATMTLDFS